MLDVFSLTPRHQALALTALLKGNIFIWSSITSKELFVCIPCKHMGAWRYNSRLKFGTKWRWVVSFTAQSFYSRGNAPPVPTEEEGRWAPERVWTLRRREKFLSPIGNWMKPQCWACSLVTILAMLFLACWSRTVTKNAKQPKSNSTLKE